MSDIQEYIKYIIKQHETLTINTPFHIGINKTNYRFEFKLKGRYKKKKKKPETG